MSMSAFTRRLFGIAVGNKDASKELNDALDASINSLEGVSAGGTTCAGGVLAIPVTHAYVAKTTGGVEALTLANGVAGQILTISLVTDGGDGTITPATKSGFSTIVLADAKDTVTLRYIDDTTGWVIVGAAGTAAPPAIT